MLEVQNLSVTYKSRHGAGVRAVRDLNFVIPDHSFVGLVGESGCGKSTLGFAISCLLDTNRNDITGNIVLDGKNLRRMSTEDLRRTRWSILSVVLQGGMNAFNPVIKIRRQFGDVMRTHSSMSQRQMTDRTAELLSAVDLDPKVMDLYPHELSGGMKQRAAIALAMTLKPRLIILDEPTTALDVVVQKSIITMLSALQQDVGFSVLFISHDLGLVLEAAHRVMVMYAGEIVEDQPAQNLLSDAKHPYTQALLACYADPNAERVKLSGIPGSPPDLRAILPGCPFVARCSHVKDVCKETHPKLQQHGEGYVSCHLYAPTEVGSK